MTCILQLGGQITMNFLQAMRQCLVSRQKCRLFKLRGKWHHSKGYPIQHGFWYFIQTLLPLIENSIKRKIILKQKKIGEHIRRTEQKAIQSRDWRRCRGKATTQVVEQVNSTQIHRIYKAVQGESHLGARGKSEEQKLYQRHRHGENQPHLSK